MVSGLPYHPLQLLNLFSSQQLLHLLRRQEVMVIEFKSWNNGLINRQLPFLMILATF